jgi:hypothetical protein
MLLKVAAHKVSIQNVRVSKRERHITYRVTKRAARTAHYVSIKQHFVTVSVTADFLTVRTIRLYTIFVKALVYSVTNFIKNIGISERR